MERQLSEWMQTYNQIHIIRISFIYYKFKFCQNTFFKNLNILIALDFTSKILTKRKS